jgi:hypothetical protein
MALSRTYKTADRTKLSRKSDAGHVTGTERKEADEKQVCGEMLRAC